MHAVAVGVDLWIRQLILVDLTLPRDLPGDLDAGNAEFGARPLSARARRAIICRGAWDLGGGFRYVLDIVERSGRTEEPGVVVSPDRRV